MTDMPTTPEPGTTPQPASQPEPGALPGQGQDGASVMPGQGQDAGSAHAGATGAPEGQDGASNNAGATGAPEGQDGGFVHTSSGLVGMGNLETGVASRVLAAKILTRIVKDEAWATPVIDKALNESTFDARDRAFISNLVLSTLRYLGTVDYVVANSVKRDFSLINDQILSVLRIGAWELAMGHAPSHAVVFAHVEAGVALRGEQARGFVNGALRGVLRELEADEWPDLNTAYGLGLNLGYPAWIVDEAYDRFGEERFESTLKGGNEVPTLHLRAVKDRGDILEQMERIGQRAHAHETLPHAIVLDQRLPVSRIKVVTSGQAVVQDMASQIVVQAAVDGLERRGRALDMCAAPGGKTTYLAQLGFDVLAQDSNATRLGRVDTLARRVGLTDKVTTRQHSGLEPLPTPERFDLVLVDAPCSGLGVMRRRPEIRWRKTEYDIQALHELQFALLSQAINHVAPGGRLVYSVCTWTQSETDDVMARFVKRHPEVSVRDLSAFGHGTPMEYGLQCMPDREQTDGMYVSVLTVHDAL